MTRSEFIAALARKQPHLTEQDVDLAVRLVFDKLCESLAQRQRVELRGFGSFACHFRPARVGRNPKNGKRVEIPAKQVPHFKPGKELRERINGYYSSEPETTDDER